MEMHQIRYFLALCEERSFTRAARQCGISQPSLTNAIIRLEQDLGGPLFERKPAVALTVLGHAVRPYLQRIAENADLARGTVQALVNVRLAIGVVPVEQLAAQCRRCPASIDSGARLIAASPWVGAVTHQRR
jgi:LysR family transcriptional regulator, hydrogen peroxide-inducible genes activator